MRISSTVSIVLCLTASAAFAVDEISRPIDDGFGNPIPPAAEPKVLKQDWGGLKPGHGREETFYACVTCHTEGRILRQRMTRAEWAITIDSLSEHNDVPPLDDQEYELILDYLGAEYGPNAPHP